MVLRAFARGGALGLLVVVVERAFALAVVVLLGRSLAAASYGRYSFLVAYLNLFQVIADFGVEPVVLRRLCQEPERRAHLLANALGLRMALALIAGLGAILLAPAAGATGPDARPTVAAAAAALLFVAQPGYRALLRSELRIGTVLAVGSATSLLNLCLVGVAALSGGGLLWIFSATAVANLTGFALAAFAARDLFRFRLRAEPAVWRDILRESWPIGANLLVVILGLRAGALLLMRDRGPVDVGYLTSASRLTESLNLLADAAMVTVFPLLSRFAATDRRRLHELSRVVAKGLAVALLAAILVIDALAGEILSRIFRPEFAAAATALRVLSWTALLAALGTLYTNLFVAIGKQSILFRLNCLSMLLQIGLQVLLIDRLGLTGAAVAALATSATSHLVLALLPATGRFVRGCVAAAAGPAACAGAILLAGRALSLDPLARAALTLAALPVALLLTGQMGRRDVRALQAALRPESAAPAT